MSEDLKSLIAKREELRQELTALDEKISAAQAAEKQAVIEKMRALMAEAGVTLADFSEKKSPRSGNSSGPMKGRTIPPKYRNPTTGQTWSGRGIKPRWMQEAEATGKSPEDFAIKS